MGPFLFPKSIKIMRPINESVRRIVLLELKNMRLVISKRKILTFWNSSKRFECAAEELTRNGGVLKVRRREDEV